MVSPLANGMTTSSASLVRARTVLCQLVSFILLLASSRGELL